MQGLNSLLNPTQMSSSLRHLQIFDHHRQSSDDFVEQMLSSAWPPIHGRDSPPPPLTSSSDDLPPFHNNFNGGGGGGMSSLMMQHEMMLMSHKSFEIGNGDGDDVINGFNGSIDQSQQFQHAQQSFGAPAVVLNGAQANGTTVSGGSGAAPGQTRQRVRARRGQATDPHSIAERLRRERIAERMKALQELVPNANKTDKASMLDEIIDYVKFLQLQVKVLSMSRLGGAGAGNPLVTDMSSQANRGGGMGRSSNGTQTASTSDSMKLTEHHVAKLMEEDMGSAMQYLQGKGLCLMPISLASAISTATCHTRSHLTSTATANGPTSPNLSALTAQSANVAGEGAGKDGGAVSKPQ